MSIVGMWRMTCDRKDQRMGKRRCKMLTDGLDCVVLTARVFLL